MRTASFFNFNFCNSVEELKDYTEPGGLGVLPVSGTQCASATFQAHFKTRSGLLLVPFSPRFPFKGGSQKSHRISTGNPHIPIQKTPRIMNLSRKLNKI